MPMVSQKLRVERPWIREFLSEFMGTFILMMVGNSSMSSFLLRPEPDLFAVAFCWGIGVMLGMLVGASNSGGHVNPMVTVGLASIGKFPWSKIPHYIVAQLLGSFVSSLVLFANNRDLIQHFDKGVRQILGPNGTGILWTTFPAPNVSLGTCVLDTVICSTIIIYCILAIIDKHNAGVPGYLHSFYVALLVMTVVWTMGLNCMCAINPARDFPPRAFAALIGYTDVFSYRDFWWIPLFVPLFGGIIGAYLYELTIGNNKPIKLAPLADIREMDEYTKDEAKPII